MLTAFNLIGVKDLYGGRSQDRTVDLLLVRHGSKAQYMRTKSDFDRFHRFERLGRRL